LLRHPKFNPAENRHFLKESKQMGKQQELLKKLSFKTVVGKVNRRELPEDGSPMLVMRVIGVANKLVTGNSDYGTFAGFLGNFEATNVASGEVFRSGKMFLPTVCSSLLEAAIAANNGANVEFGFDIGVKEADNSVGYEYTATPIIEASETDPVSLLKSRISAPALPAPTKKGAAPALTNETGDEKAPAETGKGRNKK